MIEWVHPWNWAAIFLLGTIWYFYDGFRPVRDFYVVQRLYFNRVSGQRRDLDSAHYHGFDDYLAAKACFEWWEANTGGLDNSQQEAEHSVLMVPARSKASAVARLKGNAALGKEWLHRTPHDLIRKRREYWAQIAKDAD